MPAGWEGDSEKLQIEPDPQRLHAWDVHEIDQAVGCESDRYPAQ
jgi:hypothetical protein